MFSRAVQVTLFTILIIIFKVNASDLERLTETINNHSTILNQFPEVMKKISLLENQVSDLDSSLLVIEVDAMNLEAEVSELTNISIAFTEKLNSFVSYETKSVRLEGMATYILEQLETAGGSLNVVGSQNRRTNALIDIVVKIKEGMLKNMEERNSISQKLESMKKNYTEFEREITAKVEYSGGVERKQNELSKNLSNFINSPNAGNSSTVKTLLVNCTREQQEVKAKLQDLDVIPKLQDEISKKMNNLSSQVGKQSTIFNQGLEALKNDSNVEQKEMKKQIERISPLTNTQAGTKKRLDELYASLEQVAKEQLEQEETLKQLSEQLQTFLKSYTSVSS